MNLTEKVRKLEFEARIFVSFSIVIFVCLISFFISNDHQPIYIKVFKAFNLEKFSSSVFIIASTSMVLISVLRIWSGSLLTSKTVMSFRVQYDSFVTCGPYFLVRNPIYFSDWLAMCVFSLYLPITGLLLPILFYIHYKRLIEYEEAAFSNVRKMGYSKFLHEVPRLIPTLNSIKEFIKKSRKLIFNRDGIRHNALYILFIPGFLVGYFTESFFYAVIIGIPAVVDWAIIHTIIGLKKTYTKESKVFSNVLYSQCWEDPQIDRAAFRINSDDVVFSITSGGCNLLTFLTDDPRSVIALDMNPHQNYLLELKMAAFKILDYDHLLEFMGVRESKRRKEIYDEIKDSLSVESRLFWDKNPKQICKGVIHCGRYERYMRLLRNLLKLIVNKRTIEQLYKIENPVQRKLLFEMKWNNRRWKLFTKILLSKKTMSLLFDKAFFTYIRGDLSFGDHFAEKVHRAFTELPLQENYFLRYILFGNYNENYLPYYLKKDNFGIIKSKINKIQIVTNSCDNFFKGIPDNSISKFNFTNIFEWISEDNFERLLKEIIRVAKNNAVITYRNLIVPRKHPESLSNNIFNESDLSEKLHCQDLSFIYDRYVVERIIKKEKNVLQSR